MRKKPPVTYFLIALIACFLIGILSVLLRRNSSPAPPPSAERQSQISPASASKEVGSYTILVLGVDEAVSPNPRLRAVWFISITNPEEPVLLRGFSTSYVPPEQTNSLSDVFSWSAISGFDAFDLYPFEQLTSSVILASIVLDAEGFAEVIDYLGGITLDEEEMDGKTVLGAMDMLVDEPNASLTMQAEVIRALLENANLVGPTPELTPLTNLIPEHASVSQPPPELASLAIPYLPISAQTFIVETWGNPIETGTTYP